MGFSVLDLLLIRVFGHFSYFTPLTESALPLQVNAVAFWCLVCPKFLGRNCWLLVAKWMPAAKFAFCSCGYTDR